MSTSTAVRRPDGIPDSNAAEQLARLGGPIARRRTATAEQGSSTRSQPTSRPPANADVMDVEDEEIYVESYSPRSTTTGSRQQEQGPAPLTLRASLTGQNSGRAQTAAYPPGARTRQPYPQQQPARTKVKRPTPSSASSIPWQRMPLAALAAGVMIVVIGYTIIFWIYFFGTQISNRWNYGPTPTYHLDAVIGDKDSPTSPTHFTATVLHGKVIVFAIPGNDLARATSYAGPTLDPGAWTNLDHIIVTLAIEHSTGNVLVSVVGDPNFWHFYQRPEVTYTLINMHPGFKIGTITNQAGN